MTRINLHQADTAGKQQLSLASFPSSVLLAAVEVGRQQAVSSAVGSGCDPGYLTLCKFVELSFGGPEKATVGTHPQIPGVIFHDAPDGIIKEPIPSLEADELPIMEANQAGTIRTNPHYMTAIFMNADSAAGGAALSFFEGEVGEVFVAIPGQAFFCTEPQAAFVILKDVAHAGRIQTILCRKASKDSIFVAGQPAVTVTNP